MGACVIVAARKTKHLNGLIQMNRVRVHEDINEVSRVSMAGRILKRWGFYQTSKPRTHQLFVDGIRLLLTLQCTAKISLTRVRASHKMMVQCHLQTTSPVESVYTQRTRSVTYSFSNRPVSDYDSVNLCTQRACFTTFSFSDLPSVLWRCWLGGGKGVRPVKNWVVGCWCG